MKTFLYILIGLLLIVGGLYLTGSHIIKMYACAEGGGNYSFSKSKCEYDSIRIVNCSYFDSWSPSKQADSLKFYYKQIINGSKDIEYLETLYFCTFPKSFKEMELLFGFNDTLGGAPLYHDGQKYIDLFLELKNINPNQYYTKLIEINIGGNWQADNIREAFGFHQRLLDDLEKACKTLEKYTDEEIRSVFRFIFDGPHPINDYNQEIYQTLKPNLEKQSKRLGKLLYEAYSTMTAEEANHGH